jgi:hypothetical protein
MSLAFAIEDTLSEYSSRHISERDLRNELNGLIHRDNKFVTFANVPSVSKVISSRSPIFAYARSL